MGDLQAYFNRIGFAGSARPDLATLRAVHRQRGGWCFEMNSLLAWALEQIGFDVTRVAAAVGRDNVLRGQRQSGVKETVIVQREDYACVLSEVFGLRVPNVQALWQRVSAMQWQRLAQASAS